MTISESVFEHNWSLGRASIYSSEKATINSSLNTYFYNYAGEAGIAFMSLSSVFVSTEDSFDQNFGVNTGLFHVCDKSSLELHDSTFKNTLAFQHILFNVVDIMSLLVLDSPIFESNGFGSDMDFMSPDHLIS